MKKIWKFWRIILALNLITLTTLTCGVLVNEDDTLDPDLDPIEDDQEGSKQIQNVTKSLEGKYPKDFEQIAQLLQSLNSTVGHVNERLQKLEHQPNKLINGGISEIVGLEKNMEGLHGHGKNKQGGSTPEMELFKLMNSTLMQMNQKLEKLTEELNSSKQRQGSPSEIPKEKRDKMLGNPHAILYTGENLSGGSESYDFRFPGRIGGCSDLKNFGGNIKSVDTQGTCVRLFSGYAYGNDCKGWSQAFYPGSPIKIDPRIAGVRSVGPCVDDEFNHAVLRNPENSTSDLVKKLNDSVAVPDIIEDYWKQTEDQTIGTTVSVPSNSVTRYLYNNGRLECIRADINPSHIQTDEAVQKMMGANSNKLTTKLPNENYEVGYAIPPELGGPVDKEYNVFPQNKEFTGKYKTFLVNAVKKLNAVVTPNPKDTIELTLKFLYGGATGDTRPSGVWYWILRHSDWSIKYGYIPN